MKKVLKASEVISLLSIEIQRYGDLPIHLALKNKDPSYAKGQQITEYSEDDCTSVYTIGNKEVPYFIELSNFNQE